MKQQLVYLVSEEYDSVCELGGKKIRCLSPDRMAALYPDGNIPLDGEISGKCEGTERSVKLAGKDFSVYPAGSRSPFLYKAAGYIRHRDGLIAVLRFRKGRVYGLIAAVLAVLLALCAVLLLRRPENQPLPANDANSVIAPRYEDEKLVETKRSSVLITLPAGTVTVYDKLEDGAATDAEFSLFLTPKKGEGEHTVLRSPVRYENGVMEKTGLDFTALDFELLDGDYEGRIVVERADGKEKIDTPADIHVVTTTGGSVQVSFSPNAEVNLRTGAVQVSFSEENATHNSVVKLIVVNGTEEYVIAESGLIYPGTGLRGMELLEGAEKRLEAGWYEGKLRVFFFDGDTPVEDVKSDIEMKIHVQ